MNYLDLIKNEIEKCFDEKINFSVEIPELEHGDATSNVCLIASKILKISPQEVFDKIYSKLVFKLKNEVERIEFKNPGFINFYFKKEYIKNKLNPKKSLFSFFKKDEKLISPKYNGKKVLVEFTSINLFKPFTIGHLMSNFTGEFISRSLESQGAKVVRISYPSDISIGIAKAIYIIKQEGKQNYDVKYLGECYVKGVAEYKKFEEENNLEKIQEIKNIANNLYNHITGKDLEIFEKAKKINIDYFKKMVESLGTKFDGFIYESEAGEVGKKIVLENAPKIFQKSEGAIIYVPDESRKDINTSVFINSEGNPTYLAKDIGLLFLKFEKYNPDISIYVVDNEQNAHFKSVFDAGGKIKKEWEEKSVHVSHGRMTFKGKKMSSRLGGVPSGEEVIDAVLDEVKEKSGGNVNDMTVALSALRISILRSKPGVNIDFDPDRATSFEGDSGPYLCYTHARCNSLLEKGNINLDKLFDKKNTENILSNIERKVFQFEKILKTSAEEIAPQKLVKYLFELAGEFNSFYANNKIIDSDNLENTQYNLYLTKLVKDVLKKGLHILGIEAPNQM